MSEKGLIHIFCGDGKGKSGAAIGQGIKAAGAGRSVVIIQFLKGKDTGDIELLRQLEPEIKVFSFEKSHELFEDLTGKQQKNELQNIHNGINFTRKVLSTGECDLLILDEFLGLVDTGIISAQEFKEMLDKRSEEMEIIISGRRVSPEMRELADEITTLTTETIN